MKMNRHIARQKAFQTLFALLLNPDLSLDESIYQSFIEDERYPDFYHIIEEPSQLRNHVAFSYLYELVEGVLAHQHAIDEQINRYSQGWRLNRIVKMDYVILQIAIFELVYSTQPADQLPKKAVINEAIQLAKEFSDQKAVRFINGLLANFLPDSAE